MVAAISAPKPASCTASWTTSSRLVFAAEAITAYIEANAWQVELIRQRVADSEKPDARFVPHDEVVATAVALTG